jgi:hypothetical protein
MGYGDLKIEVECLACGRRFRVPDASSPIPKHPPKGEPRRPGVSYLPCVGSDTIGIPIKPVIEGLE